MKAVSRLAALLAIWSIATPAHAGWQQDMFSPHTRTQAQSSVFLGATYGFRLDGKTRKPEARASLAIGRMLKNDDASEMSISRGLEIVAEKRSKPSLQIAGTDVRDIQETAKLSDGASAALIAVGVVAVVALVVVAAGGLKCKDEGKTCD